ncbi:ras-related protein Rab-33B-like [Euwallacea fornicatus]|uniref:ras-related protein Rab-33B-like n=1 Tax=Euwallacea fornicatus TaxID=995702 RepID=UPI00338DFB9E
MDHHSKSLDTSKQTQEKVFKVIVVGDTNVGKTTVTYRFCEGKFINNSEATIGVDFRSRTLEIDGENITLQLWDTAGQERYRLSIVRHYYRNTHAIVFVYDVTNLESFNSLTKWMEECNMNCSSEVLKILVGNKCDGLKRVPTNEAQKFADLHNMPLFETSARIDSQCDNVESIFITMAHKLKNHKRYLPIEHTSTSVSITGKVVKDTTNTSTCSC